MAPMTSGGGDGAADASASAAATFCETLVDEWVRGGVTTAVVAPGSRSTPLAVALLRNGRVRVEVVLDERSASFMALGTGLATGHPAVLLCTSGTAAAQFHAAVVEADLAAVPLLVCTADRPPELQGVGAPQTIDQVGLYGGSVRWAAAPGVPDVAQSGSWRSLAAQALLAATGDRPGPVHLNLAFREPLLGVALPLPTGRAEGRPWLDRVVAAPSTLHPELLDDLVRRLAGRRVVVVAGGGCVAGTAEAVHGLAEAANWPVLADPRSGASNERPSTVAHWDSLLRLPDFVTRHQPEVVLRVGAPPASKVLAEWLAQSPADQVVLPPVSGLADPQRRAALVVTAPVPVTLDALRGPLSSRRAEPGWRRSWVSAGDLAATAISQVLARYVEPVEPGVARSVLRALPDGTDLFVSSSMPVRDLEWYGAPRGGVRVLANRGANGIDGVVSTAVGVALAGRPTVALLGDLAFLHDTNGLLRLRDRQVDLTFVVVDNDGGGIFSFLPQRADLEPDQFEHLFGTPHGVDLLMLAALHGLRVGEIVEEASVARTVATAVHEGGVRVLVVRTDRQANVEVHDTLTAAVAEALAAEGTVL